jgi:hypothetical protein
MHGQIRMVNVLYRIKDHGSVILLSSSNIRH